MKKFIITMLICLFCSINVKAALLPGLINYGLAYWGFSQKNAFGNVAGSIFALKGTVHILTIRW